MVLILVFSFQFMIYKKENFTCFVVETTDYTKTTLYHLKVA